MAKNSDSDPSVFVDRNSTNPFAYLTPTLEAHPPLNLEQELVQCRILEQLKFPLFVFLWLSGVNKLPGDYRIVVTDEMLLNILGKEEPPKREDGYPDPLLVSEISETLQKHSTTQKSSTFSRAGRHNVEAVRNDLYPQMFIHMTPKAVQSFNDRLQDTHKKYLRQKSVFLNHNYRLVLKYVHRVTRRTISPQDLFQEGVTGLMRGVDRYCLLKGFRFSTYAMWWIRQSVSRSMSEYGRHIRIPVHMQEIIIKMNRERERLSRESAEPVRPETLARNLNEPLKRIKEAIACEQEVSSLHEQIGDDGESNIQDFIEDENTSTPDEETNFNLLKDNMDRLLGSLSSRERMVLLLRFGLEDGKDLTLEEVGKMMQITRERVRQIQDKAIKKLKHPAKLRLIQGDPKDLLDKTPFAPPPEE